MSDMKRLLEKMDQFAGQAVGQKPGDQVRGTEKATKRKDNKHPFAGRLVGASESKSLLADLEKELVEGAVKRSLAEQFAEFKEAKAPHPVAEELTPPGQFLSKQERLKAGDKVYYKGRFVGVATGHLDGDRVVFTPVEGYGTSPDFASLPIDIISLRESNQFSDLELAIMEGGNSLDDGSDMFADRNTQKIGLAIIKAGKETIADAPRRWKGDKPMIKFMTNDGNDMINVGKAYLEQGMEAGNTAFWDLDTAVRDGIYDAVLKDTGIDMNDILDEGLQESHRLIHSDAKVNVFYKPGHDQTKAQMVARMVPNSQVDRIIASLVDKFGVKSTDFEWHPGNRDQYKFTNEDAETANRKKLHPEISAARQQFPTAKSDMEALLMYVQSQAKEVKEEVPAPVATAGGPAGANQPKTTPGVTPQVDPAQQALLKQNQAKMQQNLANLKSAGVQIDPAKAAQTLQKTDTGAPMNAMDKDNIAAMAPAIGNVMANPSTATQLNTLIKKAGGGV